MQGIISEPEGTLKERWMKSPRAIFMISMLPRESWPKIYHGLRNYVPWLLEQRGGNEALEEFNTRLANAEAYLKEQVESGQLSEAEANVKRGDGIWWRALEETQNAALYIALGIILERDITAFLEKAPAENDKTLTDIQEEVELKLIEKLRQYVDINDV